jgi:hypothetical protein
MMKETGANVIMTLLEIAGFLLQFRRNILEEKKQDDDDTNSRSGASRGNDQQPTHKRRRRPNPKVSTGR